MRIAILAPHAGNYVGGLETAAKGLRRYLRPRHECEIFSLADSDWTIKVPGIKGKFRFSLVRMLRLNYLNHLLPYVYAIKSNAIAEFSYILHLTPILLRFNPDIIINFAFSIGGLFCHSYRKKYNVPFFNVGQAGRIYLEVKSARTHPDVYVALTPAARKYIQNRARGVRVEVIPNGVDTDLFSPQKPKRPIQEFLAKSDNPHTAPVPPFILSSSRLVREKRLDLLIKAVSRLRKGTLILVGHGSEQKKLKDLGRRILKRRIAFIETLSQEELSDLSRSCDVFSLPSKNEPFGNVLIEAMASGLPVVATDDPGFRWILGSNGGILVDVEDSQAYAGALQEAYKRNFGDGPEKQARKFAWPVVARKYEDLCLRIIKERSDESA